MSQQPRPDGGPAQREPADRFEARRERLLARLEGGVALLGAAPELIRSRDTEVPYRQDSDFHYLTGFEEPQAVALLTPHDPEHRFTLFVRERDPERETWSGRRLGVEGARESLGATAVYPIGELRARLPDLLQRATRLHYPVGNPVLEPLVLDALLRARRARPRSGFGPVGAEDLEALLGEMRQVKDEEELRRMRVAAGIAAEGHRAAIRHARPGVGEWELQALLEGTLRRLGAAGPSFPTIVGGGANATVLHYVSNRDAVRDGDLVLVDAGAEWGMYCSDITRTYPVSGRFTAPQRELYELVLAAEEAGIAACRPGATVQGVHDGVVRVLTEGMLRLGILPGGDVEEAIREGEYRRYYMHQSSHWLGLDVHDVGAYRGPGGEPLPLAPGMVLTVEPGIYLPADAAVPERYRGIGIRIEDDVLITAEGHEVLTRGVPVDPDEVEALVGSG